MSALPKEWPELPEDLHAAIDWSALADHGAGPSAEVKAFGALVKQANAALEHAFYRGFDAGRLVHARAGIVDRVLVGAWQALGLDARANLALVAVGGYGRGELHPHSDIDLMLLLADAPDAALEQALSRFLTFLWDIGLPVGHSVRTLAECEREGRLDITVATNLMESRRLAGPGALYADMLHRTSAPNIWPSAEFFRAKLAEQARRYRKFGDTAYRLEPHVKESPGGLRDIQMVGWIARRHFGGAQPHGAVAHELITETEYQTLLEGQDFLWRVRYALHLISGRREDRLLLDHQPAIAKLFGHVDEDHNLAVEQFMQRYYRAAMELQRLNEMLLQLYQEMILYAEQTDRPQPINRRFQARKGFLEVTDERVFRRSPSALLELFLVMQQHPELKGVRAATIRLVRSHRASIDADFRAALANRSLFMEILRQPGGITHELRRMSRYGVLAAYWPSFARLVGRMQYDLFHTYTVDEHLLLCLRNVRRLWIPEHRHELPFCSMLAQQIPKPELLYLAALCHDIGKGRGGDHCEIGAEEAERFCLDHGLSAYDARWVAWLVRHHLLMSMTAQRRDLSDPAEINAFAEKVGSLTRLNYLYLLTVSDIRATNPRLWNAWKDALLLELYHATKRVLQRGLDNPLARDELIREVKQAALERLKGRALDAGACQQLWQTFDEAYFLRHSDEEIAWHTQAVLQATPYERPLVVIRQLTPRGSTEIFVLARAHHQLFAHIASALTRMGLNVVDARIVTTTTGHTLDTFMVLNEAGQPIEGDYEIDNVTATLRQLLEHPYAPPPKVERPAPRQVRHFEIPTEVRLEPHHGPRHTLLEVVTTDHPGLLSKIGKAFIESEVLVHNARITTVGARAEDLFVITDLDHRPITDAAHLERIRERLQAHLGNACAASARDAGAAVAGHN